MITRWEQGRATIDAMLLDGELSTVAPNKEWASTLIDLAEEHIGAADKIINVSALTAFQTYYDAVHKIFDAILVNQGLRGTGKGGHIALQRAAKAQLVPPLGDLVDDFHWMRQLRNAGDYPVPDKKLADSEDAVEAQTVAKGLVAKARILIEQMPAYGS
ncbi:hypothetical protein [Arthrobacter pityocampae]|uniref:hypothetical protein n=1 Tax=Arthrobacter pityocampae TaxID=547334 RepID=UPI0037357D5B